MNSLALLWNFCTFSDLFIYLLTASLMVFCTVHLDKIAFSCRLALTCSAAWVDCPAYLELMNMQRQFTVKVNPTGLSTGVHFAEV